MITRENIKEVLQSLDAEQINTIEESELSVIELHIFNTGYKVEVSNFGDYEEERVEEEHGKGNLVLCPAQFATLCQQLNIEY